MNTTAVSELNTLAMSLDIAVRNDFMAREHAKAVWKEALKTSGLDIVKPVFEKKIEEKRVEVKV